MVHAREQPLADAIALRGELYLDDELGLRRHEARREWLDQLRRHLPNAKADEGGLSHDPLLLCETRAHQASELLGASCEGAVLLAVSVLRVVAHHSGESQRPRIVHRRFPGLRLPRWPTGGAESDVPERVWQMHVDFALEAPHSRLPHDLHKG